MKHDSTGSGSSEAGDPAASGAEKERHNRKQILKQLKEQRKQQEKARKQQTKQQQQARKQQTKQLRKNASYNHQLRALKTELAKTRKLAEQQARAELTRTQNQLQELIEHETSQLQKAPAHLKHRHQEAINQYQTQQEQAITSYQIQKHQRDAEHTQQLQQARQQAHQQARAAAKQLSEHRRREAIGDLLDTDPTAPAPRNRLWTALGWTLPVIASAIAVAYFLGIATLGATPPYIPTVGTSMNPSIQQGDLAIIRGVNPEKIEIGDAIAVRTTEQTQNRYSTPPIVLHRVTAINEGNQGLVFTTKGDNNDEEDPYRTAQANVIGELAYLIPGAGTPLLIATGPGGQILLITVAALVVIYIALGFYDKSVERARARDILTRDLLLELRALGENNNQPTKHPGGNQPSNTQQ